MKVVYSGCNWNTVVFAMDEGTKEFEQWLDRAFLKLQEIIRADPSKFKCTRRTPTFSTSIITESTNADIYPNQLRCRLATRNDGDGNRISASVILQDGVPIPPSKVWSSGIMTPIFSMQYFKDGDDFGLSLTLVKAEYTPPVYTPIQHSDWIPDTDENTTGVSSSTSSMADGFVVGK